jgi:hypothetical protein
MNDELRGSSAAGMLVKNPRIGDTTHSNENRKPGANNPLKSITPDIYNNHFFLYFEVGANVQSERSITLVERNATPSGPCPPGLWGTCRYGAPCIFEN